MPIPTPTSAAAQFNASMASGGFPGATVTFKSGRQGNPLHEMVQAAMGVIIPEITSRLSLGTWSMFPLTPASPPIPFPISPVYPVPLAIEVTRTLGLSGASASASGASAGMNGSLGPAFVTSLFRAMSLPFSTISLNLVSVTAGLYASSVWYFSAGAGAPSDALTQSLVSAWEADPDLTTENTQAVIRTRTAKLFVDAMSYYVESITPGIIVTNPGSVLVQPPGSVLPDSTTTVN